MHKPIRIICLSLIITFCIFLFFIFALFILGRSSPEVINPVELSALTNDKTIHDNIAIPVHLPYPKIGICLSGGGYRATLFDLGVLWRLNELGVLKNADIISSVSGGSIIAAFLGVHWNDLNFVDGVATNFDEVIAKPILDGTSKTIIDPTGIMLNLISPNSIASKLISQYDTLFYKGAKLTDLPEAKSNPTFVLNATSLQTGLQWYFLRDSMGFELNRPMYPSGDARLAVAVAASAGFPPFLSPVVLDVSKLTRLDKKNQEAFERTLGFVKIDPEYLEKKRSDMLSMEGIKNDIRLADGGIIDNLGTVACKQTSEVTFLVSAATFPKFDESAGWNWISTALRSIDIAYEKKETLLKHDNGLPQASGYKQIMIDLGSEETISSMVWLNNYILDTNNLDKIENFAKNAREKGMSKRNRETLINRQNNATEYTSLLRHYFRSIEQASIETKLSGLSYEEQSHLVHWGYAVADTVALNYLYNQLGDINFNSKDIHDYVPNWMPNILKSPPRYLTMPNSHK